MTAHAPRPYQSVLINDVYREWTTNTNVLAVLPTGGGKCLGKGTPVLLFDGSVIPVEDVEVGDLLMGPDSSPRRVLSLARGSEMLYRVTPNKGDPYVVNESHILSLRRTGVRSGSRNPQDAGGEVVNISVRDYLAKSKTFKHEHKGWRVGVDFPPLQGPLPVDPYFVGLWLGDGNSHNATVTTGDIEIANFLEGHAKSLGMKLTLLPNSVGSVQAATQGLRRTGRGGTTLMNRLRSLGIVKNKHIPWAYRTASRKDRLSVLAGILDSDGYYSGRGYDLTLKDEGLMDDVVFLARSLGLAATKSPCRKTCVNNGVEGGYWRCFISGHVDSIPCIVPRKKAAPRSQKKDVLRVGITVDPVGVGEYFGFEIDGDRLFILGDFTVTHNTFVFSAIAAAVQGAVCAIAHRSELVVQMSTALAREGVVHRVIGPATLRRSITQAHMREFGRPFYDPNGRVAVASVDTLVGMSENDPWLPQVQLWIQDEAHHVLKDNKWGKACKLFKNARGLGVTATPIRSDGKGLGRHADGVFDSMVVGPSMRELIEMGYLTDYRVFAPPSDIRLDNVKITDSGDYSPVDLRKARHESHITGDVVEHYLRIAPGKQGVTFDVDVESATATAAAFRAAGVTAEVVSAKTNTQLREDIVQRFRQGKIKQLVNVDLFGEGFDLPAIEVVSFARPTESVGLFTQQFGRALRILEGKTEAIIIDHVSNVVRHGLPDRPRVWSLDRREKRSKRKMDDAIPLRSCLNESCLNVYERSLKSCPYCGHTPEPTGRSTPAQVEGDLEELDPAVLARMRGEVERIDGDPVYPFGADFNVKAAVGRRHEQRQGAQKSLRDAMALWAGWQSHQGRSDAETQKRFWFTFGIDMVSAQTLGATEAGALESRVVSELLRHNVSRLGA